MFEKSEELKQQAIEAIALNDFPVELYLRYESTRDLIIYDHTIFYSRKDNVSILYIVSNSTGFVEIRVSENDSDINIAHWATIVHFISKEEWSRYLYASLF